MDKDNRHRISLWFKKRSAELGFTACGIAPAEYLQQDDERLTHWLTKGYNGEMAYLERNHDKRVDPGILMSGARSVIVFLMNYYPEKELPVKDNYKIARYAYGKDYHDVIKGKLHMLINELKMNAGEFQTRVLTDSAPVLERAWAEKAGLGWIGKNTCLIHPKLGSFVFIAEIITDLELEYDSKKINDLCGGCTKCIEACPTGALVEPHVMDSRKCISYLTIEFHGSLPEEQKTYFNDWIFGCDICQEACPWNRKAQPHREQDFYPGELLKEMSKTKWEKLTKDDYDNIFKESAMKRTRFEGLKRNIDFLMQSTRFFIFLVLFFSLNAAVFSSPFESFIYPPDTIAPPPTPGMPGTLAGPVSSCVGESSQYFIDVPVDCSCQWTVNGIPQAESGSPLSVIWTYVGIFQVSVVIACQGGEMSSAQTIDVTVMYQPEVLLGNDTMIIQGQSLLLDAGNPGSDYLWSTGETTRMITVSTSGTYWAQAYNFCGTDYDTIAVSVYVGVDELPADQDCFSVSINQRQVIISNLPENITTLQVFTIDGKIVYEGLPKGEIRLSRPGVYLIRGISRESTCLKKIIIS